jgi:DNA-directed RNA polymerase subunit RPC12/RpoP
VSTFREPTRRDRVKGLRYLAAYLATVAVAAVLLIDVDWPVGFAVWLVLVFAAVALLVRWNARHSGYRCRLCGHEFEISAFTELVSPHGTGSGGWTYLRCPRCDRRSRARVLVRE